MCRYPEGDAIICYMFVGNQPLSSDPTDVTTHRGADCCDYTKNQTRKNIKISEKNQYQKDAFMCVS